MLVYLRNWVDSTKPVWLVFPPLAVLWGGFFVFNHFVGAAVPIEVPDWGTASVLGAEATKRFMIFSILFLLLVSCGAGVLVSIWIMSKRIAFWSGACRLGVAAVAILVCYQIFGDGRHLHDQLGKDLFLGTVGAFPTPGAPAGGMPLLDWIIATGNYATIVAGVAIGFAVTTLPLGVRPLGNTDPAPRGQESLDNAARELAGQVRDLKHLLFAAAAMLCLGAADMKAWTSWPLAFWVDPKQSGGRAAYEALASAMVQAQALILVATLAALFVPVSLTLRGAGQRLATEINGPHAAPAEMERWLRTNEITLPTVEQIKRLAAIISPFLAGPVIELLQTIVGPMVVGG